MRQTILYLQAICLGKELQNHGVKWLKELVTAYGAVFKKATILHAGELIGLSSMVYALRLMHTY